VPEGCAMGGTVAAPRGPLMAIELACAFGPAVLVLNTQTGEVQQPITDSDSHFLAWAADGQAAFLRVDSINDPQVLLFSVRSGSMAVSIPELSYDVAPSPSGDWLVFSFSRGMGLGSELWRARSDGRSGTAVLTDERAYVGLAKWSPDGSKIAFMKIPDSATPFMVGELWVMNADGSGARELAKADAGHGYAPDWGPDGTQIAFVVRENSADSQADQSAAALISNIHIVDLSSGEVEAFTELESTRVGAPVWKPDGEDIAFTAFVDDRMTVFVKNTITGEMRMLDLEEACCASWILR